MLPKLFSKKIVGIDIGTSAVRLVELEKNGNHLRLLNYGEIDTGKTDDGLMKMEKKAVAVFSTAELAEMILFILAEAKIKTRHCAFSIPDFSTFFTNFNLPPMTRKEIGEAVLFEARQHIPLPIDSVTIDWQLVNDGVKTPENMEITVAAIPNEIIAQYKDIAARAKLEVGLMEAEVFGLLRALIPADDPRSICLIDMGTQSTVCSFVEKNILKSSHSFDMAGIYLMDEICKHLPLSGGAIEDIKAAYGLKFLSLVDPMVREKVKGLMYDPLAPIFKEIEMMMNEYYRLGGKELAKLILSGGVAAVPGIREQFETYFKKEVEIANPFLEIDTPALAENILVDKSSLYSVAVGIARRGLDYSK